MEKFILWNFTSIGAKIDTRCLKDQKWEKLEKRGGKTVLKI